ncbi:MAG: methyltransferase [Brevinematales bacterium]|nr:methyltransferase [Brevinematales bacterium]
MAADDVIKIRLESIAPGGDALGRSDGKPLFVEGGAPDETVLCRTIEEHKTWARAELLEIVEPSPVRVKSFCQFYGKCGGCNLQHIEYNAQLAAKAAILKDSFLRIGGFEINELPQLEIVPSAPLEYRNRMQFHCLREKAKNDSRMFGLMGRGSGEIIAVTDCPVAENGIRKLLQEEKNLPLPPEKDRFTVFSCNGIFLSENGIEKGKIRLLDRDVILDAGIFFQSNISMLEKLVLNLIEIAQTADTTLPAADFYCGVGTFALFIQENFPKVILMEENKKAVSIARENLKGKNAEFFALRDNVWEKTIQRNKFKFGFAVADPPRAGLAYNFALSLAQYGSPILAYVSCDSASLARDSKILVNGGYKLIKLKLFDFYPQTAHIESLAVFENLRKFHV